MQFQQKYLKDLSISIKKSLTEAASKETLAYCQARVNILEIH